MLRWHQGDLRGRNPDQVQRKEVSFDATDANDATDPADVTDVTDAADVADVTDVTDAADVTDAIDATNATNSFCPSQRMSFLYWKRISRKQSARWQHLSRLKASAFAKN